MVHAFFYFMVEVPCGLTLLILRASLKSKIKKSKPKVLLLFFLPSAKTSFTCLQKNKKPAHADFLILLRSRADSNRSRSFCRAQPSHSATGPFILFFIELLLAQPTLPIPEGHRTLLMTAKIQIFSKQRLLFF